MFVIYQKFPSVNQNTPTIIEETPIETPETKEIAQENIEPATSSMVQEQSQTEQNEVLKEPFVNQQPPEQACPQPSNPPGKLPTAIYGNISDNAPRPAFDPALEPTTRARILIALDALNGFMNFEGTYMEDRADPQVQLPLSTLKADIQTLTNEALVLQRNPGLRSSITDLQINEIEANLDFLQQQYRRFDAEGITK